jgi:hypothetical protein
LETCVSLLGSSGAGGKLRPARRLSAQFSWRMAPDLLLCMALNLLFAVFMLGRKKGAAQPSIEENEL